MLLLLEEHRLEQVTRTQCEPPSKTTRIGRRAVDRLVRLGLAHRSYSPSGEWAFALTEAGQVAAELISTREQARRG